jgi:glycosyltransferase involved in cell wall biosynthesis
MRVLFYAPLKPIDHPVPSGDRRLGRLLVQALGQGGHEIEIACRLRTRLARPDPDRQQRQAQLGERLAERLIERYRRRPPQRRPEAWLTYHLYYKAPDWLGPRVATALRIPYLVVEASVAPKRAAGPWSPGHRAVLAALAEARVVLAMSDVDAECVAPALRPDTRLERLAPFLDPTPYTAAAAERDRHRQHLAGACNIDPAEPWLLAVAMMREGDKLRSYEILGDALARLTHRGWRLLVAGDGPARAQVEQALAPIAKRVVFMGALSDAALAPLYAAADLLVWPAINEAFGMALLEAQAAGTPVVAGRAGGVPEVVSDGETGLLVPVGDAVAFAAAVNRLLAAPPLLAALAANARPAVARRHAMRTAAAILDRALARAAA